MRKAYKGCLELEFEVSGLTGGISGARNSGFRYIYIYIYIYVWVKGYPPLHFVHFPYNSMPFKHNVILHAMPSSI